MSEFDINLPSIRQVQNYIKDKKEVEIKLATNDLLSGTIIWQDINCLCLVESGEKQTLISRSALVYVKA